MSAREQSGDPLIQPFDIELSISHPCQRQTLAAKLLDIGKSLLRQSAVEGSTAVEGVRARDSVKWVQKAFTVTEQVDCTECPGSAELKASHPRSLALFNTD